ncbi:MAG TPA: hypothetical protein VMC09_05820 [Anaerolineales bacterium]|nr:hypothetical protein [Anaerolineales bacterium]
MSTHPIPATPSVPPQSNLGAGFRFSSYGPSYDPGPDYWVSVGDRMSAKFPGSQPEAIWIVGNFTDPGTYLSFPVKTSDPNITFAYTDMNEQALNLFDQKGFKIWLQVEPGNADMVSLIDLVLGHYGHHPSVIGFGVDVEWYKSNGTAEGTPVTDAEASIWAKTVRAHNPAYRLFLKHWDYNWMPPSYREGIVFVDDSQQFESFQQMIGEFAGWGKHFADSPVAFQFGYPDDKRWWGSLNDPPLEIGQSILKNVPNTSALFWVDFTVLDVFPPQP